MDLGVENVPRGIFCNWHETCCVGRVTWHRNSQKRFYIPNAVYFVTTCTENRQAYFSDDVLCEAFVENMNFHRKLKGFAVLAYKINPEHVHLLIRPGKDFDISQIMFSLKKQFACNVNRMRGDAAAKFVWQSSYHDHVIRDERDLRNHVGYIWNQWIKHDLKENKWCYVDGALLA
jgi:putative transposase